MQVQAAEWGKPISTPLIEAKLADRQQVSGKIITLFRIIIMAIQYAALWVSILFHRWSWLSSTIAHDHLKVSHSNIASFKVLQKCVETVFNPISKRDYARLGNDAGLRVTEDFMYRPASGLCLGSAMVFLSLILPFDDASNTSLLEEAVFSLKRDCGETILWLQALYDALIAADVKIPQRDLSTFRRMLLSKIPPLDYEVHHEYLKDSLEAFLALDDQSQPLRQFVLDDLDKKNVDLTSDLYALALELDAYWQLKKHSDEPLYLSIHCAILQTIAKLVNLELLDVEAYEGSTALSITKLLTLSSGGYLLQFRNHTIAFVKTPHLMALFDPSEGLGVSSLIDQENALFKLLGHYSTNETVSIKIIPVQAVS